MNITVYTTVKNRLKADKENVESVVRLLSYASGQSPEEIRLLIAGWQAAGKRIVHYYPGLGDFDPAGFEYFGDIPDGTVYIG